MPLTASSSPHTLQPEGKLPFFLFSTILLINYFSIEERERKIDKDGELREFYWDRWLTLGIMLNPPKIFRCCRHPHNSFPLGLTRLTTPLFSHQFSFPNFRCFCLFAALSNKQFCDRCGDSISTPTWNWGKIVSCRRKSRRESARPRPLFSTALLDLNHHWNGNNDVDDSMIQIRTES